MTTSSKVSSEMELVQNTINHEFNVTCDLTKNYQLITSLGFYDIEIIREATQITVSKSFYNDQDNRAYGKEATYFLRDEPSYKKPALSVTGSWRE